MILVLETMKMQTSSDLASPLLRHLANEAASANKHNGNVIYQGPAIDAIFDAEPPWGHTVKKAATRVKFDRLAKKWKENRQWGADITELCMQPAYQAIIGMGETAIPYILRELSEKPDHWFWALNAIIADDSVDPIPTESQGKLREMAQAWIDWGRQNGQIE
ncbi:MAG: hypothetical protein IH984_16745 [Planctomycetes bacterium]|nr:hypothetical protein [Planctomycetota bacterium]